MELPNGLAVEGDEILDPGLYGQCTVEGKHQEEDSGSGEAEESGQGYLEKPYPEDYAQNRKYDAGYPITAADFRLGLQNLTEGHRRTPSAICRIALIILQLRKVIEKIVCFPETGIRGGEFIAFINIVKAERPEDYHLKNSVSEESTSGRTDNPDEGDEKIDGKNAVET